MRDRDRWWIVVSLTSYGASVVLLAVGLTQPMVSYGDAGFTLWELSRISTIGVTVAAAACLLVANQWTRRPPSRRRFLTAVASGFAVLVVVGGLGTHAVGNAYFGGFAPVPYDMLAISFAKGALGTLLPAALGLFLALTLVAAEREHRWPPRQPPSDRAAEGPA